MSRGPSHFEIAGRRIGPGEPAFVVAELSANHRGSFEEALALVNAAADAGADAVKLQTYTADTLTLDSDRPEFRIRSGTLWDGTTLHRLYAEAYTPWEWHAPLLAEARRRGLIGFSTPFDSTAIDFLETLDVPAHKLASFELVDLPLIERIGRTGRPVIASTGMATLAEIDAAVRTLRSAGCPAVALLKCSSSYPARWDEMNLRTLPHLAEAYGVPVGLSDHSPGIAAAVAAVALGANVLEKHLTLSRAAGGPDAAFSLEPAEFAALTAAVRQTEAALGSVHYGPTPSETAGLGFRRSLFVVRDIRRGEPFTPDNVRSIRPAGGLPPGDFPRLAGRRANRDLPEGTPLLWDYVGD